MKGDKWHKKGLNTVDLKSPLSPGIVAFFEKGTQRDSMESTGTEEKPEPQETVESLDGNDKKDGKISPAPNVTCALKKRFPPEEKFSSLLDKKKKKEMINLGEKPSKKESEENTPFSISLWDLGGQDEFISTPHLFLNIDATILIVMDITKELYELIGSNFKFGYFNSAVNVLHYWLNFFHNAFEEKESGRRDGTKYHSGLDTQRSTFSRKSRKTNRETKKLRYWRQLKMNHLLNICPERKSMLWTTQRKQRKILEDSEMTYCDIWRNRKEIPLPWLSLKADIIDKATKKNKNH